MKKASAFILSLMAPLLTLSASAKAESIQSQEVLLNDPNSNNTCLVYFEKSGPGAVKNGDYAIYHIKVENRSDCIFRTLRVTDRLSRHMEFIQAHPKPDFVDTLRNNTNVVGWKDQRLRVGETLHYAIKVRVEATPGHTIVNQACVKNRHLGPDDFCVSLETFVLPGHPRP